MTRKGDVEGEIRIAHEREALADEGGFGARDRSRSAPVDPNAPFDVIIDGAFVAFAPNELARSIVRGKSWVKGEAEHDGVYKHGAITGPIHDAFHSPLLFVYGASDPAQARANEEVARAWAVIRAGTTVKYPVLSDEFFARGEAIDNDRSLFLVGNAKSNRVLRRSKLIFQSSRWRCRSGRGRGRASDHGRPGRRPSCGRTRSGPIGTSSWSKGSMRSARGDRSRCRICCPTSWSGTIRSCRRAGRCCSGPHGPRRRVRKRLVSPGEDGRSARLHARGRGLRPSMRRRRICPEPPLPRTAPRP